MISKFDQKEEEKKKKVRSYSGMVNMSNLLSGHLKRPTYTVPRSDLATEPLGCTYVVLQAVWAKDHFSERSGHVL